MSNRTKQTKSLKTAAFGNKKSPHITKITASSTPRESQNSHQPSNSKSTQVLDGAKVENVVKPTGKMETRPVANPELNTPKKLTRAEKKAARLAKKNDEERPLKSYFLLVRPFVALGRYLRDSWREIRQVRWPNRKATWKMTLAVLIYVAFFIIFLTLIDILFTFIFDLLFKQ